MMDQKQDEKELSIFSVALQNQYRLLSFEGLADGTNMTPQFDIQELRGKELIIKSIRLIPYAPGGGGIVDISLTDGVSTFIETLGGNIRLDRITDLFNEGTSIRILINGTPCPIFSQNFSNATGQYIPDLWEDNIFYRYPAKLEQISCAIFSTVTNNLVTPGASVVLNMRVLIGCYLR